MRLRISHSASIALALSRERRADLASAFPQMVDESRLSTRAWGYGLRLGSARTTAGMAAEPSCSPNHSKRPMIVTFESGDVLLTTCIAEVRR